MAQLDPTRDEELMARTAAGDALAFRTLIERHQGTVYRLARRQLGSDADAEDLVQDVFHRLFVAARRYRAEASLRTFVLTIASRLCLNRRARAERRLVEPRDVQGLVADGEREPEQERAHDQRERQELVRRALAQLPGDQRLAILLQRFEGLEGAEIARVMKRSVGSVHALLFRARSRLRELLLAQPGQAVAGKEAEHEPDV